MDHRYLFLLLILSHLFACLVGSNPSDQETDLLAPHPNIFIDHVLRQVSNEKDLIFFNGHVVKKEFGKGLLVNAETKIRTWGGVAALVNKGNVHMRNYTENSAIHVHNEFMAGDLVELLQREAKNRGIYESGLFTGNMMAKTLAAVPMNKPIVMTNTVDENWGFISTPIGTRTAKWINLTNHLRIHHANYDTLRTFINSDRVVLTVVNSHQDPALGANKKIISLPLGIRHRKEIWKAMLEVKEKGSNKTKLFTINNSGWKERTQINNDLIKKWATYNMTLLNTFPGKASKHALAKRPPSEVFSNHYFEVASSKFLLCPSGLSMDSYRLWETLALGTIPVVESNPGFDRTYSNLPVLVVHNYTDLTPELLNRAYECFYENADRFKYIHLSLTYWHKLIHRAVKQGSVAHVTRYHPFRNAYCNFLDDNKVLQHGQNTTTGAGVGAGSRGSQKRPDGRSSQIQVNR